MLKEVKDTMLSLETYGKEHAVKQASQNTSLEGGTIALSGC